MEMILCYFNSKINIVNCFFGKTAIINEGSIMLGASTKFIIYDVCSIMFIHSITIRLSEIDIVLVQNRYLLCIMGGSREQLAYFKWNTPNIVFFLFYDKF